MNWKELLFEYLEDDLNRKYSVPIFTKLLQANFRKGKFVIRHINNKLEIKREEIKNKSKEICEFIVRKSVNEGYNAMVIPFIISKEQAPNFYITSEKPQEEELWWWLYHLITGLHYGNYVINLANVDKDILEKFREYLKENNFLIFKEEKLGLNIKEMLSKFSLPGMFLEEFIFGFLIIAYFSNFLDELKRRKECEEKLKKIGYEVTEIPWITEDSSLLIFVLSRQKKRVYIFPKLRILLSSWFNEPKKLSSFLFSFYITDKSHRDLSRTLLNKLLYYFLQNKINGDLLNKLIELKISYELKKKDRIYRIKYAKEFFSKL